MALFCQWGSFSSTFQSLENENSAVWTWTNGQAGARNLTFAKKKKTHKIRKNLFAFHGNLQTGEPDSAEFEM